MKAYDFRQPPFRVFGVPFFEETGRLERLPPWMEERLPKEFVSWRLSRRCPGARLRFRTDSGEIGIRVRFASISVDPGMSLYSCQGVNGFAGSRYLGLARPESYETPFLSGSFRKDAAMEDVTVFLPRNEIITGIDILLEDHALLEPPTAYRYPVPILYYGNSVTEGACCSKPANAYSALLSRWLDADYVNFGFSGSAKGELVLADYIHTIPKSILVMDYDHNAPDAAHLRATHRAFFERVRTLEPTLPVVFMSASNFEWLPDAALRRQIIRDTYEGAKAAGDENVYFIDGQTLWGQTDRDACTADCLHPNDLGMYRTAQALRPVIEGILHKLEA